MIRTGGLDDPQVIALLDLHAREMSDHSPPGTCHFLDLSGLTTPDISFFSAWDGDTLLAVGALKQLDPLTGEVKSMRATPAARGRGIGFAMLDHIVGLARERDYATLKLETGTGPLFEAAHALYRRYGFVPCPPFAGYVETDFNRFYALDLTTTQLQ